MEFLRALYHATKVEFAFWKTSRDPKFQNLLRSQKSSQQTSPLHFSHCNNLVFGSNKPSSYQTRAVCRTYGLSELHNSPYFALTFASTKSAGMGVCESKNRVSAVGRAERRQRSLTPEEVEMKSQKRRNTLTKYPSLGPGSSLVADNSAYHLPDNLKEISQGRLEAEKTQEKQYLGDFGEGETLRS